MRLMNAKTLGFLRLMNAKTLGFLRLFRGAPLFRAARNKARNGTIKPLRRVL